MTRERPLHLALIGYGPRGHAAVEAARATALYKMTAIAEPAVERRRSACDAFGFRFEYDSYETLLADQQGQIDVLHVATLPALRLPVIQRALTSGVRAIVVEKPMELSYTRAQTMVALCEEAGVLLVVNHQTRYMKEWMALKLAIAAGQLGEPLMLRAQCSNLLNQGTHMLDMAWNVLGQPNPRWVLGGCTNEPSTQVGHACPRSALALIEFEHTVRGSFLFADQDAPQFLPAEIQRYGGYNMEVRGSAGSALAVLDHGFWRWDRSGNLVESFETRWDEANVGIAQQRLSREVALALNDPTFDHPLRGTSALISFALVEAIIRSSYAHEAVSWPLPQGEDLLTRWTGVQTVGSRVPSLTHKKPEVEQ